MERVANMTVEVDLDTVDTSALIPAVEDMLAAQRALGEQTDKDEAAYAEMMLAQAPAEDAAEEEILEDAPADAEAAMDMDMSEDEMMLEEEEPEVDMSGFVATEEMNALSAVVDEKFAGLSAALQGVSPDLSDAALETLRPTIESLLYQRGDTYETQYDRLNAYGNAGFTSWVTPLWRRSDHRGRGSGAGCDHGVLRQAAFEGSGRAAHDHHLLLHAFVRAGGDLRSVADHATFQRRGAHGDEQRAGPGHAAGHTVRHRPQPRPAAGHCRRPRRRSAVHRVWLLRPAGLPLCHRRRLPDRGLGGHGLRRAAQPPQGQRDVGYHVCGLFDHLPDVHRLAAVALPVRQAALAPWPRPARDPDAGRRLPPYTQRLSGL